MGVAHLPRGNTNGGEEESPRDRDWNVKVKGRRMVFAI